MKKLLILIGVVGLAYLFWKSDMFTTNNVTVAKLRSTAPAWELKSLDGQTLKSSDFKGKVVVLVFWATWCRPCLAEIPDLVSLQNSYGKDGLTIVGISVDRGDPAKVQSFAKEKGLNYPVVFADKLVREAYGGIEVIPATFLIDKEGKLASKHLGLTSKLEFEQDIKELL